MAFTPEELEARRILIKDHFTKKRNDKIWLYRIFVVMIVEESIVVSVDYRHGDNSTELYKKCLKELPPSSIPTYFKKNIDQYDEICELCAMCCNVM
jgi:hypothetical protein